MEWLPNSTTGDLASLLMLHLQNNRLLSTEFGPLYEVTFEEWAAIRWLLKDKVVDNERTVEEAHDQEMIDLGLLDGVPVFYNRTLTAPDIWVR